MGVMEVHRVQEIPDGPGNIELLDMIKHHGLVIEEDERADPSIKLIPQKGTTCIFSRRIRTRNTGSNELH